MFTRSMCRRRSCTCWRVRRIPVLHGHFHPSISRVSRAGPFSISRVPRTWSFRSHWHVGSTTASTTTASIIVAFSEAYLQIIKNGVRTYTHDITLQVFFFFLYTTPPIRRRLALSSSLQLLWIDCAVLGVAGRIALLGRNRGSRCSRIGYYWCKSTLRSRLGLMGGHWEGRRGGQLASYLSAHFVVSVDQCPWASVFRE